MRMNAPLNMVHKKRTYSPTIDDIRQHNIKRFRLLSDFNSLNLSGNDDASQSPSPLPSTSAPAPLSSLRFIKIDKNKEYIPDIDEFLVQNQEDGDIIESSKRIPDLQTIDPDHIVIPGHIVSNAFKLTGFDSQLSFERVRARRNFEKRYGKRNNDLEKRKWDTYVSNREIVEDFTMLKFFGLVKYYDPIYLIYKIWESWYLNVFKLREFDNLFNKADGYKPGLGEIDGRNRFGESDDDLMIDDDYDENNDQIYDKNDFENTNNSHSHPKLTSKNAYSGYYNTISVGENTTNNDSSYLNYSGDEDMMDLD